MATRPRRIERQKKTVSIKHLARKDHRQVAEVELQADATNAFEGAGFRVVQSLRQRSLLTMIMVGYSGGEDLIKLEVIMMPTVRHIELNRVLNRRPRRYEVGEVDETWVVGKVVHPEVLEERRDYAPGLRILRWGEMGDALRKYAEKFPPPPPKKKPIIKVQRTRIGKAVVVNATALSAAITTSVVLIEERLVVLSHHRPNSAEANAQKDDEVQKLTELKRQLEVLRTHPEALKQGSIKEKEVASSVKSFSQGVAEYWTSHYNEICDKAFTFGLFSSLMVVGNLSGAVPEVALGLSGTMAYGKPVVDALKAMKGWFKFGK
ncbi:hypothetical protein IQ16_02652 [Bradyrhizobium huanghuaihaiense]|uniref:Uncharacterized protein n=1 Tax=Bradyrhizobium huanghuaihaiense TaxID=990078 RepID=A0A562RSE9_9BRAD|nr:hypothetical protein [Bradyrhizobium huanghuaihaiense]TWI71978.1 hypothetical protein IQ16_02652 [Bradyrhizobium huanghuaihaiense]